MDFACRRLENESELFQEEIGFIMLLRMMRRRRVQKQNKQNDKFWRRQIFKERKWRGTFNTLYRELHLRMSPVRFQHLLSIVENPTNVAN